MASKAIAAETCRRLAVQYQGLVEAAELLESAEVSESYLVGLKKEIESTRAESDKTKQVLSATKDELKKVQAAGVQELRTIDLEATKRLTDANAEAARLIQAAKAQAVSAIEAEKQNQTTVLGRLQEQVASASATFNNLEASIREKTKLERDAIEKATAATEALAAIQAQATKMAQKMANLSGG